MNRRTFLTLTGALPAIGAAAPPRRTEVSIRGEQFFIDGKPTYAGRSYQGLKIEGLLMNVRAVQGIFDDLNPETRGRWAYRHRQMGPGAKHPRVCGGAARVAASWAAGFHHQPAGRQPRGLLQEPAVGEQRHRLERESASGVHGSPRPRPRPGRRVGNGGHRRLLLLRAGPAREG